MGDVVQAKTSVFDLWQSEEELRAAEERAAKIVGNRQRAADAIATAELAALSCPPDLIEWGRIHGIPTFAELTWQAGFAAGWRAFLAATGRTELEAANEVLRRERDEARADNESCAVHLRAALLAAEERERRLMETLSGWLRWHADIVLTDECWAPLGTADLPRLTQGLLDRSNELAALTGTALSTTDTPTKETPHG